MDKRPILLLLGFLFSTHIVAQISPKVLGLRMGTGDGFGLEVSYQHGLSMSNRLEIDLGLSNHHENQPNGTYDYTSWGLTGLYHWVYQIDTNLGWYLGPGGKVGAWNYEQGYGQSYENGIFLIAAGDIGMEYSFPAGIQLALNARPEIGLINHGTTINIGLAIRYQFK